MNWKRWGKKRSWPDLRYYVSVCLEGLKKTSVTNAGLQDEISVPGLAEYQPGEMKGYFTTLKSRDSSVGIALGYGLDDRGSGVRFLAGVGVFL
jgi:hypothetical protein